MKNISTDKIIAIGLLLALVISFFFGSSAELQTAIVAGLVGYLGKVATEHASTLTASSTGTIDKNAIVKEVMELVTKQATQKITNSVASAVMEKIGGKKDGHNSNT